MMFQCHLPLHHWVEAFATASYIINMLPSSVLNNVSPFEKLFGTKHDYTMLRAFGSACYPYLRPLGEHKFEPKSLKCVFLGYHTQYKGYRCLHPPTGKVFITIHAVFDESCFPFKEDYKELVPRYESSLLKAWQSATSPACSISSEDQITRALPFPVCREVPEVATAPSPVQQ